MKTTFFDKNGVHINTGDKVRFTTRVRVGTNTSGRGRNFQTYAIYEDRELTGRVVFSRFKKGYDEFMTFIIRVNDKTSYDSYFFSSNEKDAPRRITEDLSEILTTTLAKKCEVIK